mgnify:CR=1 FL=1
MLGRTGIFAILLAEAGYQVTAIDYTEEMLKEAQQNAGGMAKCIVWKPEMHRLSMWKQQFRCDRDPECDLESSKTGSRIQRMAPRA